MVDPRPLLGPGVHLVPAKYPGNQAKIIVISDDWLVEGEHLVNEDEIDLKMAEHEERIAIQRDWRHQGFRRVSVAISSSAPSGPARSRRGGGRPPVDVSEETQTVPRLVQAG